MPETIQIAELMASSQVKFGTSGARGKVEDLTDRVCYAYTKAFLTHLANSEQLGCHGTVAIAGDLRASTPGILRAVSQAITDFGFQTVYGGLIPSPAIAYFGLEESIPSIMVTGSHIPDDRNGIKFNTATGEITKPDELGIKALTLELPDTRLADAALPELDPRPEQQFIERYVSAFGSAALAGLHIGVYQHTSVARDLLVNIFEALGAKTSVRGRAEKFTPVDTEAIRPEDVTFAHDWARADSTLDAIVSTDGDADRPLLSTANGDWLRGDVLGILVSQYLKADCVATPVSSNTALEKCEFFKHTARTRIGSPFVIEAMAELERTFGGTVVGYEANGGFMTQSTIALKHGELAPLPTRDCVLPLVATLCLAKQLNKTVAELVKTLPPRFTASDRVKAFPTELSAGLIDTIADDDKALSEFIGRDVSDIIAKNQIDGLRIFFNTLEVMHFRPSGNAPEFRCYVEAGSAQRADELLEAGMRCIENAKP